MNLVIFVCLFLSTSMLFGKDQQVVNIIPKPNSLKIDKGNFKITAKTKIITENTTEGKLLQQMIFHSTGLTLETLQKYCKNSIVIEYDKNEDSVDEKYSLKINPENIIISAGSSHGIFNGIQTLRQIIPLEKTKNCELPCLLINDEPRFKWRGFMLDVSRHFHSKEFIIKLIDYLAMHKMNVFHWHLIDDQGWRIEIKKYPKLTDIGAWRVDRETEHWRTREEQKADEKATYGGFYTQDEIREVVKYAEERHITIVPEIEIPAHTQCAVAAYPEISCTGGPFTVPPGVIWPHADIYCPGKEKTYEFLENVLIEVMELFPSEYIHIGGDEADKSRWKECPDCQEKIKNENLADENELQSYFIKRIEKFLNKHNRRLIGWDEIIEGGLAPNATVMYWRGWVKDALEKSAQQGHDVIMTPNSHCYINYYQGDQHSEVLSRKFDLPIEKVYSFDPCPEEYSEKVAKHIIGGQANLWGEYINNTDIAMTMIFPRLAAMSEVLWTSPEQKDFSNFCKRLLPLLDRYKKLDIPYSDCLFQVKVDPVFDEKNRQIKIDLSTEFPEAEIRYTLDGTKPDQNSQKYTEPFYISEDTKLWTLSLINGNPSETITKRNYCFGKSFMKPVILQNQYDENYSAGGKYGLVNGILGTKKAKDGHWQGVVENDFIATVDLGEMTSIESISVNFLQCITDVIFLPLEVQFLVSSDNQNFRLIEKQINDISPKYPENIIKNFSLENLSENGRYVKIIAKNRKTAPKSGIVQILKTWLFVDEIVIK